VHARQGAVTRGQKPSKRGYLFGFGIAEESYRIMIYATAAHGLCLPTAPSTRTPAWVSCRSGQATNYLLGRSRARQEGHRARSRGLRRA
jgi:hypothetical protein